MFAGFVRPPSFVTLIDLAPVDAGVYLNVAEGAAVVRITVVGENDPSLLSCGVIVTGAGTTPPTGNATVKLVDCTPTIPELGPLIVYDPATAVNPI